MRDSRSGRPRRRTVENPKVPPPIPAGFRPRKGPCRPSQCPPLEGGWQSAGPHFLLERRNSGLRGNHRNKPETRRDTAKNRKRRRATSRGACSEFREAAVPAYAGRSLAGGGCGLLSFFSFSFSFFTGLMM